MVLHRMDFCMLYHKLKYFHMVFHLTKDYQVKMVNFDYITKIMSVSFDLLLFISYYYYGNMSIFVNSK